MASVATKQILWVSYLQLYSIVAVIRLPTSGLEAIATARGNVGQFQTLIHYVEVDVWHTDCLFVENVRVLCDTSPEDQR